MLLDTHVVIWLAFERRRLSNKALSAITQARRNGDGLGISGISLWEIANAVRRRKLMLDITIDEFFAEVEGRFTVLPINGAISAVASRLPHEFPKDPGDRLIAGTALVHGLMLVTADDAIRRSRAVPTLW